MIQDKAWPGNVRQLESAIERAILLCEGDMITPEDLPTEVQQETKGTGPGAFKLPPEGISFEEVEKNLILQAMDQTDYNITKEIGRASCRERVYISCDIVVDVIKRSTTSTRDY